MLGLDKLFGAFSDEVVAGLIGFCVSTIAAFVGRGFGRRRARRMVEALTGFDLDERPLAVIGAPLHARAGSTDAVPETDALPLFGYGPLMAYATLAARHFSAHADKSSRSLPEIVVSTQFAQLLETEKRDRDLLLLGYPAGNEATRFLEPLMKLPIGFAPDGRRAIQNTATGRDLCEAVYKQAQDGHPHAVRDCGLIACVDHPLNSDRTILYLAGCETFGVKIAADAVNAEFMPDIFGFGKIARVTWKYRWLPSLGLSKVRTTEFLALLEGGVDHLVTSTPRLTYAWIRSEGVWTQTFPKGARA